MIFIKTLTNCKLLVEKDEKLISKASRTSYFPLALKKGAGAQLEDMDGNKYIDFFSSAAVLNTGINHPKVVCAIKEQLDNYIHFSTHYMYSNPQVDLAQALTQITPGSFNKKVVFGYDIELDVLIMGKAIVSGLPMSAIVAREEIVDALLMPAHLFTLQGNAAYASAALATIDVIKEDTEKALNIIEEVIREYTNKEIFDEALEVVQGW